MNKCDSECRSYFKFIFMHQLEWRKWFGKFMLWILKIANCKQFIAHSPCPCACRSFSAGHSIILRWFHSSVVLLCCWYGLTIRSTNKQNTIIYSFLFIGFGLFCFFFAFDFWLHFRLFWWFYSQLKWCEYVWNVIRCHFYGIRSLSVTYECCTSQKSTLRCTYIVNAIKWRVVAFFFLVFIRLLKAFIAIFLPKSKNFTHQKPNRMLFCWRGTEQSNAITRRIQKILHFLHLNIQKLLCG